MKRAKRRQPPVIRPIELWDFCRGLRKASEAVHAFAVSADQVAEGFRRLAYQVNPQSANACAEAESVLVIARLRSKARQPMN